MADRDALNYPRRGDVYLVNFDPTVGAEIKKTRPALIVPNGQSPITIVAAITSQFEEPLYPTEVFLPTGEGGMRVESVVLLNQIRSVDKRRLVRPLGSLRPPTLRKVDRALGISLGLLGL
jgi:mRNA interferase MazF